MKKGENKNGFTIIEVVLVLGIAGLIFLMMMIALPALRRTQADAQRKDDIAVLLTAIKKYQSNNRGALPSDSSDSTSWANFATKYLPSDFSDPDGVGYNLKPSNCTANNNSGSFCTETKDLKDTLFPNNHELYIIVGATCDGSLPKASANRRKVAVAYRLETDVFCNNT